MPGSTPTLRDMVKDALDRGQTYRQLAERAVDPQTGQTASLALINDIARGQVNRAPSVIHLRALAAALERPFEAVRQAAIRQWLPAANGEADAGALLAEARELTAAAAHLAERAERMMEGGEAGSAAETA